MSKEDALQDIVQLAKHNQISLDEIAQALSATEVNPGQKSSTILSKLFGYIGGIFVFAGLAVFISMYWDDFGSLARVIVTLGSGLFAFVMGLVYLADSRYQRAVTPLFLISSVLQPLGIFVLLEEYSSGGDWHYGVLLMSAYMLIQQWAVFYAKRITVLAFSAILFGSFLFATLFDLWDFDENLTGFVIGTSLLCIAYALSQSRHLLIAPFWYFVGSVTVLWSVFDAVRDTPFEVLHLGLSALIIFLSTYVRSGVLILVGTVSMLSYISYYTAQHFANTLGWPIALVMIGIALIFISSIAIRLNNKFIK
ncbi:MAG TPA: DUF2157 domain-containing protein [Methylophilaceae bacterium]|nr:DUF2157 domain-containing protein [Methylophilaceae bacterium]